MRKSCTLVQASGVFPVTLGYAIGYECFCYEAFVRLKLDFFSESENFALYRCGRFPPEVRTAIPVDGRFEHIVLSCNATSDHAIIWIEREAEKALGVSKATSKVLLFLFASTFSSMWVHLS